ELTKVRLPPRLEDLRDGAALAGRDHGVGLDEAAPQAAGEQAPDRGLAGSHEADEDHVPRRRGDRFHGWMILRGQAMTFRQLPSPIGAVDASGKPSRDARAG